MLPDTSESGDGESSPTSGGFNRAGKANATIVCFSYCEFLTLSFQHVAGISHLMGAKTEVFKAALTEGVQHRTKKATSSNRRASSVSLRHPGAACARRRTCAAPIDQGELVKRRTSSRDFSAMAAAITDAPAPGSSGGFANLSFRRKSRTCSMDAAQSPSNNPNTPAGGQPSASSSSLSPAPAPESSCVSPLTDNVDAHVPRRASHRGRSVSFDDQSAPGVAANAKMASASQGVLSGCVARVAPFTAAPESVAGMRVNVADYE